MSRIGSRRGILLPVALFVVLALSALATSVLVLIRSELLLERRGVLYLQGRVLEEGSLASEPDIGEEGRAPLDAEGWSGESGGADPSAIFGLPGGVEQVRAIVEPGRPAAMGVRWRLDPDSVAAALPAALGVGFDPPDSGVERAGAGCPAIPGAAAPLIRVRPPDPEPAPDPPLPDPPRIGILGLEDFENLSAIEIAGGSAFPAVGEMGDVDFRIFRAEPGGRIAGGSASGILYSLGDLTLDGASRLRGLVLSAGDLHVLGEAVVEGVVMVGGTVHLQGNGRILGCRGWAAAALGQPALNRTHRISTGDRLGRF